MEDAEPEKITPEFKHNESHKIEEIEDKICHKQPMLQFAAGSDAVVAHQDNKETKIGLALQ